MFEYSLQLYSAILLFFAQSFPTTKSLKNKDEQTMRALKSTIFFFILNLFFSTVVLAQNRVTLSGYIKDSESGEALIGGTVFIKETGKAVEANTYGFYSISMPVGTYTVLFSYVGYATVTQSINLLESKTLNPVMVNQTNLDEVEVTTERKNENVSSTDMGTISLSIDKVKTLPVIFGETDILKTLQLMPGIQSAGEGNSGFYVRGGGPDQNLILLDEAIVYNTGHLFGFFSVFNSDAIKNVNLIKGGMPANYGGRLSAVVDVSMKEGNMKKTRVEGGIGLIASRLLIEGPIKKDKGSFIISGRRTYIDVLTKPFASGSLANSGYFFYDANLKANYAFSEKDRVYLSGYFGRDKFKFGSGNGNFNADIPWGNNTATLRWNHLFSDKLFLNTSLIYNQYQFSFGANQKDFVVKLSSGIRDYSFKTDLDIYTTFQHHFKTGLIYAYHKFTPNQISGKSGDVEFNPDQSSIRYGHEAAVYLMDEFDLGSKIRVNAGLRYSGFGQVGPFTNYSYDFNGRKTDSSTYSAGELVKTYGGWEPRLNLRYTLSQNSSLKGSVTKNYQYLHLLTNNGSTLPTDVWFPSSLNVKPQQAWQYSLGYFQNLKDNAIETSVEVYYKNMNNQIEFREGYTPTSASDAEKDFVFGKGEAYGAEFFVNKTKGKFTGWIGYTLSWTSRQFNLLNNGNPFPAKYDRRHDLSLVASYELNKKWTFSAVFVFGSGNAITLPTNFYFIDQQLVQQYSELNAYRLPPYHRLDISAIYKPKPKRPRRLTGSWAFSIYNVYSRQNPYFLYVDQEGSAQTGMKVAVKQVSIFPILPSITYNFSFN